GQASLDLALRRLDRLLPRPFQIVIMHRLEQGDQALCHRRRSTERLDHSDLRISEADLPQIAEPGAEQQHALGRKPARDEQLVERIVLRTALEHRLDDALDHGGALQRRGAGGTVGGRSEEHTSELQSQSNLVCRLLLEKKKKKKKQT